MKNPKFELWRRLARQYHRNKRGDHFEQGICIRHDYSGCDANALSWWDDVQFILGGRRITVTWRHPRFVYQKMVQAAAYEATRHLHQKIEGDLFDNDEKTYRKVGRSRKKVVGYTTWLDRPGKKEWFDALQSEEARLSNEAEFSIVPSFKVEMLAWCRFVEIVAPVEVRNSDELRTLANLVRRILKGETTLEREFPGYVYGKTKWVGEGLAMQASSGISHRIAGT